MALQAADVCKHVTSLAPFRGANIDWLVEKLSAALQGDRRQNT
jgi:hypothetical protein